MKFSEIILLCALCLAACSAPAGDRTILPKVEQFDAVRGAQDLLFQEHAVALESIELVKIEDTDWSDSCLGLGRPDESCLAVITPGFRIELRAEDNVYVIRTDQSGNAARLEAIIE